MTRPAIYNRPAKPMFTTVTRRRDPAPLATLDLAAPIAVDKATECHVTPADVAARMVRALGPCGDIMTLEPSAGTGQLVRALLNAGQSKFEVCMIERHHALAAQLHRLGPGVLNRCFLEYADEARGKIEFPRVIMNPPFSKVRQHIGAALSLMGRGGHTCAPVLVALVPITFDHPAAETLETLPPNTFALAKVHTKIIRIER
jgi:hypothetical protein